MKAMDELMSASAAHPPAPPSLATHSQLEHPVSTEASVGSPVGGTVIKASSDVTSKVRGRSQILTPAMIQQLEQVQ